MCKSEIYTAILNVLELKPPINSNKSEKLIRTFTIIIPLSYCVVSWNMIPKLIQGIHLQANVFKMHMFRIF